MHGAEKMAHTDTALLAMPARTASAELSGSASFVSADSTISRLRMRSTSVGGALATHELAANMALSSTSENSCSTSCNTSQRSIVDLRCYTTFCSFKAKQAPGGRMHRDRAPQIPPSMLCSSSAAICTGPPLSHDAERALYFEMKLTCCTHL